MSSLQRVLAAMIVAVMVLGLAPTASADRRAKSDPSGDAIAQADIRKVRATYGHRRLEVRVRIPKLGKRGFVEIYVDPYRGSTYPTIKFLRVKRSRSGVDAGCFHYSDYIGEVHRYKCNVRGSWSRDPGVVTVSAPKRCIKLSGVKLNVISHTNRGDGDYDRVKRFRLRYN